MKFFKKRSAAALVAVIAAILCLFLGTSRSLSRLSADVEKGFTDGVEVDGYVQPSIQRQLDNRKAAAMGLVTVGNHYPELRAETAELSDALHRLQDAAGIEAKYIENEALEKAYTALSEKLRGSVSADDSDAFESYISTLSGAQAVIKQSSYNSTVSEYYRTARSMPAAVFGIFAKGPEFFGVEG